MRMRLGDKRNFALLVLLATVPVVGRAQENAPSPAMQKLLQNCDAHKFETVIQVTEDGKTHDSKVRVCGTDGQSDADWIRTLKDAVSKTSANEDMPAAMKQQLVGALNVEIARLTALLPVDGGSAGAKLPPPRRAPTGSGLASDYSSLPPMPAPVPAPAPANVSEAEPVAPSAAPLVAPVTSAPAPTLPPPPRVRIKCAELGDESRADSCFMIERDNLLVVEADDPLKNLVLRFFRRGEPHGEVEVALVAPGRPATVPLPTSLCSGVSQSKVEIRAATSGSAEAVFGPFALHC
jgi:hypothetical protein